MPRLPRITAAELLAALHSAGWETVRQRGSHVRLAHPNHPTRITVAVHSRDIVKAGTLSGILEQAGLTVDDLVALL